MSFFRSTRSGSKRDRGILRRTRKKPPKFTPCGYCFDNWATGWDHLVPWSYTQNESEDNLYPCCRRCNSILNNKMFDAIEEKREYVRQRLMERGEWT